ncbi:hypothetical protein X975_09808, partial [Stegodyphus mimosarum]
MLLFFVILCIIVLLPWTDGSFKTDFQTDYKKAQFVDKNKILIGLEFTEEANHERTSFRKNVNENIPRLKMEKVSFDGANNVFLEKIIAAANEQKG